MNEIQSQFWSKLAKKYDAVVDLQLGPKTRSMVGERLAQENHLGAVVEFGCGTGFYTEVLASKADSVLATHQAPGMLELARARVQAAKVKFQREDCQKTSLPDAAFDTAFMSLVIHFTEPTETLNEMRRILKSGGLLLIVNLDFEALHGLDRIRCRIRTIFHGLTRYRTKPPKGLMKGVLTEKQLCDLRGQSGFKVLATTRIKDVSRSSYIPVEYIRAVKA
jgi:ubiquinone/menaquinone biosynthesis C-methylase UbiE